jgi:cell shape-determining protein MreC
MINNQSLQQFGALLIMLAFLAQTFSKSFIVADYYMNTGSFAKNCVNKAKPKMHCNGKCQMMKKLKEQEKKEQQAPERKAELKVDVLSSKSFFTTLNVPVIMERIVFGDLPDRSTVKMPRSIFHPPGA